jgi:hypothetical protein
MTLLCELHCQSLPGLRILLMLLDKSADFGLARQLNSKDGLLTSVAGSPGYTGKISILLGKISQSERRSVLKLPKSLE